VANKEGNPQTADHIIQVRIAFDLSSNTITLTSTAPAVMLFGILEQAKVTIIQKQIEAQMAAKKIVAPTPAEVTKHS